MAIKQSCPHCDKLHEIADTLAGKEMRCESCQKPFQVALPAGGKSYDDELSADARKAKRKPKKGTPLWAKLAVAGFALLCIGLPVVMLVLAMRTTVTKENYDKLKVGMTESEVKAILGSPRSKRSMSSPQKGRENSEYWSWWDDRHTITVIFVDGKAVEVIPNFGIDDQK